VGQRQIEAKDGIVPGVTLLSVSLRQAAGSKAAAGQPQT
jgi:hypothetical protein